MRKVTVMRKFLISLLLAGAAATPAIAQDDVRAQIRAERQARADSRQEAREPRQDSRADRSSGERPQYTPPPAPAARVEGGGHAQFGGYAAPEHFNGGGGAVRPDYSGGGYYHAPANSPAEARGGPPTVYVSPRGDSPDSVR